MMLVDDRQCYLGPEMLSDLKSFQCEYSRSRVCMFMCNMNAFGMSSSELGYADYALCLRTEATFYLHHKLRWIIC